MGKRKIYILSKRWALPIAVILLPGGFVLLAVSWFYKAVLKSAKRPGEKPAATSVPAPEAGAFFSILRAHNQRPRCEVNGVCIRPGAMRRHPAVAVAATVEPPIQKAAA